MTIITDQSPQQCDLCGKIAELRPYGPNGEKICFECGMKDEEATKQQFLKRSCPSCWPKAAFLKRSS